MVLITVVAGVLLLAGPNVIVDAPYAAVGLLLAIRRPSNSIGWILCSVAVAGGLGEWGALLGAVGVPAGWTAILGSVASTVSVGLLFLLAVVFPSGRLPDGRWAWVVRAEFAVLTAGAVLVSLPLTSELQVTVGVLTGATLIAMFLTATGLLVLRFRQASGVELLQLKWVIASLITLILGFAIALTSVLFQDRLGSEYWIPWIPAALAFPLPPLAVGVAVMRYRLYDIDRIVNRALVFGALTAILAGVFAAAGLVTQRLFVMATGQSSDAGLVLATLAAATLYAPLRARVETIVDRRFRYEGQRFGPYRDDLDRFLSLADPVAAARRLARETVEGLDARGCAVLAGDGTATATSGEWPLPVAIHMAIPGGHGALEAIVVGPRRDRRPHDPRALAQLEELAQTAVRIVDLHPARG